MVTLKTLDRYQKLLALATHARTPREEAQSARRQATRMEIENPGIERLSRDVSVVLAAGGLDRLRPETEPEAPTWVSGLTRAAEVAGRAVADGLERSLDGVLRDSPLAPGDCIILHHNCAPEQVCLEIRVRAADARASHRCEAFLSALRGEMVESARRR